jgi:hypothetical protein
MWKDDIWKGNVKMHLRTGTCSGHGNELSDTIKRGEILD